MSLISVSALIALRSKERDEGKRVLDGGEPLRYKEQVTL